MAELLLLAKTCVNCPQFPRRRRGTRFRSPLFSPSAAGWKRYTGGMSEVTRLLDAAAAGDRKAAADLLPLVYDELRKLAAARMAGESPDHTLQPTALVHEAYLRLVGRATSTLGRPRALLRRRRRGHAPHPGRMPPAASSGPKRGGDFTRLDLDPDQPAAPGPSRRLLALDEALDRLAADRAPGRGVVKLRYFAGLTVAEAAAALGISPRTADRRLGLRPGLARHRPPRRGLNAAVEENLPISLRDSNAVSRIGGVRHLPVESGWP